MTILSSGIAAENAQPPWFGADLHEIPSPVPEQQPIRFRRFVAWPAARALLCGRAPVELGSRAFDLLITLLMSRGEIVSKQDIVKRVWPSTFVDESNLRFQVSTLRRALGPDADVIKTIPGRGYLLLADIGHQDEISPQSVAMDAAGSNGRGEVRSGDVHRHGRGSATRTDRPVLAVIDSDAETQTDLCSFFALHGIEVLTFGSLEDFLLGGLPSGIACVILDVWLPGRSGLALQAEMARLHADVPVIFVSSHSDVPTVVNAMKAGATDFLTKPVRHLDLLEAVRFALHR
jgi:DNA-binding response OmpR family regulator